MLDGHNRLAIAAELGVPCPEIVHECGPAQREVLRIELNGARRQITADDWKPLVDHLHAQRTDSGVRRFSDRVIARAVGVGQNPSPATSVQLTHVSQLHRRRLREDGKVRHSNPEWTAKSRVLHLIAQFDAGLTAVELLGDEVLGSSARAPCAGFPVNCATRVWSRPTANATGRPCGGQQRRRHRSRRPRP